MIFIADGNHPAKAVKGEESYSTANFIFLPVALEDKEREI